MFVGTIHIDYGNFRWSDKASIHEKRVAARYLLQAPTCHCCGRDEVNNVFYSITSLQKARLRGGGRERERERERTKAMDKEKDKDNKEK